MNVSNYPLPLAANWKRIGARLFDLFFFTILSVFLYYFIERVIISKILNESSFIIFVIINFLMLLFFIFYYVCVPVFLSGRTLGKKIFSIRCQTINKSPIPYWFYFLREFYIVLLPIFISWSLIWIPQKIIITEGVLIVIKIIASKFLFFWFLFVFIYQAISPRKQLFYDRWKKVIVVDDKIINLQENKKKSMPKSTNSKLLKSDIPKEFINSPYTKTHLKYLNNNQKAAVLAPADENLLIIAGPGTGKTTVLIERIAHFIEHLKITPERILTLTFTKKACHNIQERLAKKFHNPANIYRVFTYHGFCYSFLREEINWLKNSPQELIVLDAKDRENLIKELLLQTDKFSTQKTIDKQTLKFISSMLEYMEIRQVDNYKKFSDELQESEIFNDLKEKKDIFLWKFLSKYRAKKKQEGFFDFWDLLIQTYQLLSENKNLLKQWSARYDFIVIDEFQDTSAWQYKLITLLSNHGKQIKTTVVGDPDQTIYGWRNARIEFILNFNKKFIPTKTINLIQNYRSSQNVVEVANLLINNNKKRLPKKNTSHQEKGEKVSLISGKNNFHQAEILVKEIQKLIFNNVRPRDIVVLYRSHYLSAALEKFLINEGVPYVIFKGVHFFIRREIKNMSMLMMLVAKPTDFYTQTVLGWIKNLGPKTIAKIKTIAHEKKLSIFNFLIKIPNHPLIKKHEADIAAIFGAINQYRALLNEVKSFHILVKDIYKKIYTPILKRDFLDSDQRAKNVRIFIDVVRYFEKHNMKLSLVEKILRFQAETKINTADTFVKNPNSVSLMTIHNAKGLEYENVFIYDVSNNTFPPSRCDDSDFEEERRLFFVALTRAKSRLFVFSDLYNPSIFIDEIKKSPAILERQDFSYD